MVSAPVALAALGPLVDRFVLTAQPSTGERSATFVASVTTMEAVTGTQVPVTASGIQFGATGLVLNAPCVPLGTSASTADLEMWS